MLANEVRGTDFNIADEYRQNSTFYRSMYFLEKSKYITITKKNDGHKNFYELTEDGELLAKLLCLLDDIPNRLKELYNTIFDDELKDSDIEKLDVLK